MKSSILPFVKSKALETCGGEPWFRIMSYNVLAQSMIRREMYPTNGNIVKWKVRWPLLAEEIKAYKPNLLCFQEVDESKLKDFRSVFDSLGLKYDFVKSGTKAHGLVIAWDASKFAIDETSEPKTIEYDDYTLLSPQASTGNIGRLVSLRCLANNASLIMATTHLYWHPAADYERFRQTAILLKEVSDLKHQLNGRQTTHVVIAADYNSTPSSPAYKLLADPDSKLMENREIKNDLLESLAHKSFGPFNAPPERCKNSLLTIAPQQAYAELTAKVDSVLPDIQNLGIASAYRRVTGSEPQFTNWTSDFRETIDYIFTSKQLIPTAVIQLPLRKQMGDSLPRSSPPWTFASDHLPLVADIHGAALSRAES